jgi:hypothetical protein
MQMPDGRELPPTGREAIWESVDWITLRDGRIHTWRVYQDTADFMASLGLMDEPAATPAT